MRENLARFKVPRDVMFLDALPRNPTGKVLKAGAREASVSPRRAASALQQAPQLSGGASDKSRSGRSQLLGLRKRSEGGITEEAKLIRVDGEHPGQAGCLGAVR